MLVVGVASSFHPIVPGVMFCVAPSDVIISAITPDPGKGSVVSFLEASAVLAVADVYNVTHEACVVAIFNYENAFAALISILLLLPLRRLEAVALAVVLEVNPTAPPAVTLTQLVPSNSSI